LIIAQAGRKGAVTISTNMAGRGVDIILGGDPPEGDEQQEVRDLGGLHVIGTERHESRRIDNQLRGRAGRQGDPGSSRFYISLQDELMRVFGGERVENIMNRFGIDDTMPMEAGLVSRAIENAQKKVEGFNFDRRKYVVEMDDVINVHRDVIYRLRRRILELGEGNEEYADWFLNKMQEYTPVKEAPIEYSADTYDEVQKELAERAVAPTEEKDITEVWSKFEQQMGRERWMDIVSQLSLPVIDMLWMEHLVDMDHLRDGVNLRGYAQKDPKVEYKNEGHQRFEILVGQMYSSIVERLLRIKGFEEVGARPAKSAMADVPISYTRGELETGVSEEAKMIQGEQGAVKMNKNGEALVQSSLGHTIKIEQVKSGASRVGRNDPCPCGSGKKFKKCHGRNS
jgi:preprotein translocase subunit SecA